MKHLITVATVAALPLTITARAESDLSTELRTVRSAYEITVQSALTPINERHAAALQQLLQRAQAAGDKQTTRDTLIELRKLGSAAIQYTAKTVFEFTPSNE